jgi:hypothetical protein
MKAATDTITAISQGFVPLATGAPVPDPKSAFFATLIAMQLQEAELSLSHLFSYFYTD